jgi:hypothetical protein
MVNIDVEKIYQKRNAFSLLGPSGMFPRFNFHGFINEGGGDNNQGYTQIFRIGALEATMAGLVREHEGRSVIHGLGIEEYIFNNLAPYIEGLRDLGVPTPLVIMITLEGMKGAKYVVKSNILFEDVLLAENILRLPECVLDEYGSNLDYHKAVRPAFDTLWNSIGYPRSQNFNEDGRWVGNRK